MNNLTKTVVEKAAEKLIKNHANPLHFEKEMYPFHLPKLPFKYKDFHPNLSEDTLELHHK